jgi:hypothetical protein
MAPADIMHVIASNLQVPGSISVQYTRLSCLIRKVRSRESGVRLPAREFFILFYYFYRLRIKRTSQGKNWGAYRATMALAAGSNLGCELLYHQIPMSCDMSTIVS